MNQPALFELASGRSRHSDPTTSVLAARKVDAEGIEQAILRVLGELKRATDDEICAALPGRLPASCKTARSRLLKAHKVRWTGVNRLSNAGSLMQEWTLAR